MRRNEDKGSEKISGASEQAADLRKMPRKESLAYIMRRLGVDRVRAEFILALQLGETGGDAFIMHSGETHRGPSGPEKLPDEA